MKNTKIATTKEVAKQISTKQESKEKKEMDLRDELKVKQQQLQNNEVRLKGGETQIGEKIWNVPKIDDEIKVREIDVEMTKIMITKFAPLNPRWMFENDSRWRQLQIEKEKMKLTPIEVKLEMLKEEKETMTKDIPELKKRINEIEKELKIPLTDFKEKNGLA